MDFPGDISQSYLRGMSASDPDQRGYGVCGGEGAVVDTLVFERRGMSSSIPGLVLTAGKGIKAGKYKREVSKVRKKNMIAKDSTGGRWLWDPKIR